MGSTNLNAANRHTSLWSIVRDDFGLHGHAERVGPLSKDDGNDKGNVT